MRSAMTITPMFQAIQRRDAAAVQALIGQGADMNAVDERGRTPMLAATHANNPAIVKLLIDAGADLHKQDHKLDNPFLYAGAEGYLEIVRLTLAAGANTRITNRYGGVALIPASEHGYVDVVRELLTNSDINVNHVNNLGWTALLEAIILGTGSPEHIEVVRLLLEHGADVHLADHDDVTPLTHARRRRYHDIANLLIQAGALY
nr:ankyrin repeat domain-containing protein [Paenibacillus silvisoli]